LISPCGKLVKLVKRFATGGSQNDDFARADFGGRVHAAFTARTLGKPMPGQRLAHPGDHGYSLKN
jgi:hypothetical protein